MVEANLAAYAFSVSFAISLGLSTVLASDFPIDVVTAAFSGAAVGVEAFGVGFFC